MKNAADHKENVISGGEGESERDDETSDSASESSVVSVETCTEDLDVELPHTLNGAVLLNEDEEERGAEPFANIGNSYCLESVLFLYFIMIIVLQRKINVFL